MHYTAEGEGRASAERLFEPHTPASSAHFLVDRQGDVYQLACTSMVTWHAGRSLWRGQEDLNKRAIGIEFANYGYWRPGVFPGSAEEARKVGWLQAAHKNGGPVQLWEPFPEPQIKAGMALTQWLVETHPSVREIVGHDDVAPGRKFDPGPAFPLYRFNDALFPDSGLGPKQPKERLKRPPGRPPKEEQQQQFKQPPKRLYKVNDGPINVRAGPGQDFEVLPWGPLDQGAPVEILQEHGKWAYVEGRGGQRGYVWAQYLSPA